ncbi:hypothetical protein [Fredinandcohnia quinoae]|uniref:Uncharacterized protein n=1 Tax=Fredinandcohnia quinoae TaxID=2918902 RepID=A0AAW5E8H2_9BACI|nr:hypothetical protein [Fredinandcohnia sp. SECRCQ15]MCH1625676.1 hypothetical protein [Fredinandcohnia sp. SECRCQ15]
MVTFAKRTALKLDKVDNQKILHELKSEKIANINPDYRAFLNSCIRISANVNNNKTTHRIF